VSLFSKLRETRKKLSNPSTFEWEYGGGKKKAAKVGIGLAIGGVALAITIEAGGAALIAGLAAAEDRAVNLAEAR